VFEHACNLINERMDVLSIVTSQIGNGPFNLVIEDDILFSDHLNLESPIFNAPDLLTLGDLTIHMHNAALWSPGPNWENLHARRVDILELLAQFPVINYESAVSLRSVQLANLLASALAKADLPASLNATQKLAGLGIGLTPAGDDFMMGAVLAAWIIHPPEVANGLAKEVTDAAAELTTSLSGAWLRSAGRGETGILWHQFFNDLISADQAAIKESMDKILSIGETSGADALTGFLGVSSFWAGIFRENTAETR